MIVTVIRKGEAEGHPFRGNQWTSGLSGSQLTDKWESSGKQPRIGMVFDIDVPEGREGWSSLGGNFVVTDVRGGKVTYQPNSITSDSHVVSADEFRKTVKTVKRYPDPPQTDNSDWTTAKVWAKQDGPMTEVSELTGEHVSAIKRYRGEGDLWMNSYLRTGNAAGWEKDVPVIDKINDAVSKSTIKGNQLFYRGIPDYDVSRLKAGDVIDADGFVSATTDARVASWFAETRKTGVAQNTAGGTYFNIVAPAGSHVLNHSEAIGTKVNYANAEVIFSSNAKFRVHSIKGNTVRLFLVHDGTNAVDSASIIKEHVTVNKGEAEGHPFRGNQYTTGYPELPDDVISRYETYTNNVLNRWADRGWGNPPGEMYSTWKALGDYKGEGYQNINKTLRKGGTSAKAQKIQRILTDEDSELSEYARVNGKYQVVPLNEAPEDMRVYRAIGDGKAVREFSFEKGMTFTDKGFSSTAMRLEGAMSVTDVKVLMKINVPKGSNGMFLEGVIGGETNEHEWLLPANSKFLVNNVTVRDDGVTELEMDLIK